MARRFKAKIELMNDEDVQKALETMDAEIHELEAEQRLKQAADTIQSIIDDYGKTPSAKRAARMLDASGDDAPRPTKSVDRLPTF